MATCFVCKHADPTVYTTFRDMAVATCGACYANHAGEAHDRIGLGKPAPLPYGYVAFERARSKAARQRTFPRGFWDARRAPARDETLYVTAAPPLCEAVERARISALTKPVVVPKKPTYRVLRRPPPGEPNFLK